MNETRPRKRFEGVWGSLTTFSYNHKALEQRPELSGGIQTTQNHARFSWEREGHKQQCHGNFR